MRSTLTVLLFLLSGAGLYGLHRWRFPARRFRPLTAYAIVAVAAAISVMAVRALPIEAMD